MFFLALLGSSAPLFGLVLFGAVTGPSALPSVAWIMMFNAVTLWTLVTLAVASALVLSTLLSAVTTPLLLTLVT